MNGDILIVAVFTVTVINLARYVSSLRALVVMLRDANPLLYQQICRRESNFFHFITPRRHFAPKTLVSIHS